MKSLSRSLLLSKDNLATPCTHTHTHTHVSRPRAEQIVSRSVPDNNHFHVRVPRDRKANGGNWPRQIARVGKLAEEITFKSPLKSAAIKRGDGGGERLEIPVAVHFNYER